MAIYYDLCNDLHQSYIVAIVGVALQMLAQAIGPRQMWLVGRINRLDSRPAAFGRPSPRPWGRSRTVGYERLVVAADPYCKCS